MSIKLHCADCNNDYDTILTLAEISDAVCPRCGSFGSSVPVTDATATVVTPEQPEQVTKTSEEPAPAPVTPASTQVIPPRSTSRRLPKKPLIIVTGALIAVIIVIIAIIVLTRPQAPGATGSTDTIVIEKETPAPAPAPAAKAEDPTKPAASPNVSPAKKAPKKKEKTATPQPWKYTVTPAQPAPAAPKPQARPQGGNGNVVGKLFEKFTGPAPDVTPPPPVNDPRGSGM